MRLDHFAATAAAAILIGTGLLWAQRFPDLDNQVPEVHVTEVLQSGNELKVTIENISSKTIRGLSLVLGKHRVDKDWSSLPNGGLTPSSKAILTISTAGLPAGGTRHHPAPPGTLQVVGAVFADGGPVTARAAGPPAAAVPLPIKEAAPPVQAARKAEEPPVNVAVRATPVKPTPPPTVESISKPKPPPVVVPRAAEPQSVLVPTAPTPAKVAPVPMPPAPAPRTQPTPAPAAATGPTAEEQKTSPPPAPARASGQPGTREQGSKDELARLISLVAAFEPELASPYPRPALRKMVAAVVKQQNESTTQSAVTAFDKGQGSTLQAFAFGLQTIQDRRDLDDDMLREQVQRFLKNRRQTLAK